MGPGGQLTILDRSAGVVLLPPEDDTTQHWTLAFDSGTYTLQNVEIGLYLGNDGDPNDTSMMVKGTRQPFTWQLSTGTDDEPNTYVLTSAAASAGLALTISLLRIYPPRLAILDPHNFSVVEWTFKPT
jgi:hypothetical protein